MRNLKKYLSVLLAVAMILTAMAPAFAAGFTYETEGAALKDLGIIEGVSSTDLGLGLDLNREQGIKLVLGLVGKLKDAEALTSADATAALANFTDAAKVSDWAKPYVAYAVKNKIVDGMDATTLAPQTKLSGKMLATLILRNIGYTVNDNDYANAASILADKGGLTADQAKLFNDKDLIRDDMVGMAYGALKAKDSTGKTVIANLVAAGVVSADKAQSYSLISADATAATVAASSAKSFKVTFNSAVADTSKVAFTVKRETTTLALTTTWNDAKTEATLTYSANLPEASYTIAVVNDGKDLGTSTVAITAQKIGKIEITSTKLSIVASGKGYATYKVYDQYNNDITSTYFANNITFQTGVGSFTSQKNGILEVTPTPGTNLIQFANVVITGWDTTSGVSVTATLATSTALGTLSDFKLGDVSNITLTAGDVTSVYYIPYTALDMSGNETKSYDLVYGGLILNAGALSVSNPNVTAKIVKDPADSTKAAVELKVITTGNVVIDMPVTITAMTYTGKSSTINTTLKKAAEVATFTLMAPDYNIAIGDTGKTIPFEAYDQNGNKITKYDDLYGKVTLSGGIDFAKKVDGSAKINITPNGATGPQILTAIVTGTGKMSTLTINIQKTAEASSLELDTSVLVTAMENGAVQKIDFGYDAGGLKVKDQYGRDVDMTTVSSTNKYKVKVTSATGKIAVGGAAALGVGATQTTLTAADVYGNSDTVTFTLFNDNGGTTGIAGNNIQDGDEKTIDTKSILLSVIKSSDIKSYTIDAVTSPIYANATAANALLDREKAYYANPKVYGKTASGAKVLLAGTPITGVYVDNTSEFTVTNGVYGAYDVVKVAAGKLLDPTKTEASTTLTVAVKDSTNAIHSLTTSIKSSTAAPTATDLILYADNTVPGVSVGSDSVTFDKTNYATVLTDANIVNGAYIGKYTAAGATPAVASKVYFYAIDQYGKKAMQLAQFSVVESSIAGGTVSVSNDGQLTITGALAANDYFVISAVTNNGLVKTFKFKIK